MKTKFILIFLFTSVFLNAQNPADLAKSDAVLETQNVETTVQEFPEEVLRNSISNSLSKKGKRLEQVNSDGSIYIIASATTARPSNMSGFINSRNIAYSIAELTAKMNLLRMAGETITSGRDFTMLESIIEGEDPDASKEASTLKKAGKLLDKSIDQALSKLGVSDEEISSMSPKKKEIAYQQNFNSKVKSLVSGMVKGCAVVRIAEGESGNDDYQVSVCMKYSPELNSLATMVKDNPTLQIPKGKVSNGINKIQNMPENKIIGKLGAQVLYNEKGEMIIIGYGQQEIRKSSSRQSAAYSRANSQARLSAINNIKNFVAEDIVATESSNNVEKLRDYADGTNAYFSKQEWENAVKSKETTLNISTYKIKQWRGIHSVSGQEVAGVVMAWTPDNTKNAAKIKESFNKGNNSNNNKSNPKKSRTKTTKSNTTITGDDDDL